MDELAIMPLPDRTTPPWGCGNGPRTSDSGRAAPWTLEYERKRRERERAQKPAD